MTMQRKTDPLPAGRYWIDVAEVPEGQIADFQKWAAESGSLVSIESTEEHPRDEAGGVPARAFFIFRVKEPGAFFNPQQFGFPTIAADGVKGESDTIQALDDASPASALRLALIVGGVALVAGVAFYFATKRTTQVVLTSPALG